MGQKIKMCITAEQALKFKEFGINQLITPFIWGFKKAEHPASGDNGYYHLLFIRQPDGSLTYLYPEREYTTAFTVGAEIILDDYAAAYTADHLAQMLDSHFSDIEHDEGGELLDQTSFQIIPYSNLVWAMADRILINLSVGEYSAIALNQLLSTNEP